jgi:hypothetical protein
VEERRERERDRREGGREKRRGRKMCYLLEIRCSISGSMNL